MVERKNPTIRDIANLAKVSTTTVSHVLNRSRTVSATLSKRVLAAVGELEYKPNAMARGLRTQSSKTLGLIIPDNTNPFFGEMALGAEDCAFRHGYSLLLCNSRQDLARELTYISSLTAFPVDGLILGSGSISEQHLHDYTQNGTPVVIIDRQIENVQADAILSDHFQGAKGAVEHLIELGHRRIAIITGPMDLRPAIDRMRGYQSALREHAIESRPEFICEGDFQVNSGREAAAVLFNLADPPSAIFASNDLMAIGVLDAARKLGLQAPQDFSLVGFDDIFLASLVQPPLTTVAQPAYRLGELAVERLFKRIGSVERLEPQEFCLSTDLIIRESARRI